MDGAGPWGRERSLPHWIPSGGRHPGFRECVALRGAMQERGPWSVHEDGGSIQPSGQRIDDDCNEGCSRSSCEEGNLHPRLTAAAEGVREGPSLRAPRLVQSSAIVQRPSPQAVVGSRRRPQAASRLGGGFRGRILRRACSVRGVGIERAVTARGTRAPSSRGEGRRSARNGESECKVGATAKSGGRPRARIGCSRVCPCVGSEVAEVVGRQSDPEKRASTPCVRIAERAAAQGRGSSSQ